MSDGQQRKGGWHGGRRAGGVPGWGETLDNRYDQRAKVQSPSPSAALRSFPEGRGPARKLQCPLP